MLAAVLLLTVITTATTSDVPLSAEIRDVIDKYLTQKIAQLEIDRTRDVQRLTNRVAEVEDMRARDVQMFVARIQEVEDRRVKDARVFKKRIQEMNNLRARDVQVFSQRLQEMADKRARDMQTLSNRLTEVANQRNNECKMLSSRLAEMHKMLTAHETKSNINSNAQETKGTQSVVLLHRIMELKSEHAHAETMEKYGVSNKVEYRRKTNDVLKDLQANEIETKVDTAPRERQRRVATEHSDGVAFHAVLANPVHAPAQGHIIQFQTIKTNIGATYHATTGVFTCVQPGIYVFSWSLRINFGPGHGINTQIVRNGVEFGSSSVGSGGADDKFSQSSATAATHLAQGDEVWIRVDSLYDGTDIVDTYSMFTGFLVHQ